ncbi:hypothetical protein JCM19000A_06790 [Silvimonas sp. JCM 19000]
MSASDDVASLVSDLMQSYFAGRDAFEDVESNKKLSDSFLDFLQLVSAGLNVVSDVKAAVPYAGGLAMSLGGSLTIFQAGKLYMAVKNGESVSLDQIANIANGASTTISQYINTLKTGATINAAGEVVSVGRAGLMASTAEIAQTLSIN